MEMSEKCAMLNIGIYKQRENHQLTEYVGKKEGKHTKTDEEADQDERC